MVYRLKVRRLSEDVLELRLGWAWRLFFTAVAGFIAAVGYFEGPLSLPAIAIGVVSLSAAVYQESWRFDRADDVVVSRLGIIFLHRTRRLPVSSLVRVSVRVRTGHGGTSMSPTVLKERGSSRGFQRGYASCVLVYDEDQNRDRDALHGSDAPHESDPGVSRNRQRIMIQTESLRNQDRARALATVLSEFLELPLTEES
jgi:hypothetical protein